MCRCIRADASFKRSGERNDIVNGPSTNPFLLNLLLCLNSNTGAQLQQKYWVVNRYYFAKVFSLFRYMDADVGTGAANGGGKNLRSLFTTYDVNANSLFVSILVRSAFPFSCTLWPSSAFGQFLLPP